MIEAAMRALPENCIIDSGKIEGLSEGFRVHHHNRFLSIEFLGDSDQRANSTSDFQLTFTPDDLRLSSIFGTLHLAYPNRHFSLSPSHFQPWWEARRSAFAIVAFVIIFLGMLILWMILASVYSLPLFVISLFGKRRIKCISAWFLAGTSLVPGTIILIFALVLYSSHLLGFFGLIAAIAFHLIVGWIFAMASIFKVCWKG